MKSTWHRVCLAAFLFAVLLFPSNVFAATTVKGRAYVQNANDTYVILTFQCTPGASFTGDLDYELNGVDHLTSVSGTCSVPASDGTLTLNAQAPIRFPGDPLTGTLLVNLNGVRSRGKTFTADTTCATSTCIEMTITGTTSLNFSPSDPTAPGPKFGTTTLSTH